MTNMTMPMLKRIIDIHKKIASETYPNTPSIAEEYEVSIATVSRDIAFLKNELHAPIAYDRTENGYYYTRPFELCFKF